VGRYQRWGKRGVGEINNREGRGKRGGLKRERGTWLRRGGAREERGRDKICFTTARGRSRGTNSRRQKDTIAHSKQDTVSIYGTVYSTFIK
jgi:hypothetical protein